MKPKLKRGQRGSAVEFALVAMLFITLFTSIIGFGHWMATLEMLADATRAATRAAVVCDMNDTAIRGAIQGRVPQLSLTNSEISLQYLPAGCTKFTCQAVSVSITGATYQSWIPVLASAFPVPAFSTTLPRESLESTNAAGEVNPVCG